LRIITNRGDVVKMALGFPTKLSPLLSFSQNSVKRFIPKVLVLGDSQNFVKKLKVPIS
jgi:hypothetical protein